MATKKVTSKREINNVLDNLVEVERSASYADCPKEYTYTSGTFRCTIDTYGTTLEEQKKMLIHRASCLDRYSIITPAELNRRSNRLQRAMAFIGEHREIIPFLAYYQERRKSKGFTAIYNDWKRKGGAPSPIMDGWANYGRSIKQPELGDLVAQLPYIPKAWRCA